MDADAAERPASARLVVVLRASAAAVTLLFALLLLVRGTWPGQNVIFDVLLFNVPYVACSIILWVQRPASRTGRWAWRCAALAMAWMVAANAYFSLYVLAPGDLSYPSPADVFTALSYLCLYVFLGLLLRSQQRILNRTVWLDGWVAALGAAALASGLLVDVVLAATGAAASQVMINLSASFADIALILIVLGGTTVVGTGFTRTHLTVTAALTALLLADGLFVAQQAVGSDQERGLADLLYLCVPTLLAFAPGGRRRHGIAHTPEPSSTGVGVPSRIEWQTMAVPAAFTGASLVILVIGQSGRLSTMTSLLAASCIVAALLRMGFTFIELRDLRDVHRQARTDDLTRLPNRRALMEHLTDAAGTRRPAAILLLDLDGFKHVNDTFGHLAGDQLLITVAHRLRQAVSPPGFLARLGGDEFAVLLTETSQAEAMECAHGVELSVARAAVVLDTVHHPRVSIGIRYSDGDVNAMELLRGADIAMYKAKRSGVGRAVYPIGPAAPSHGPVSHHGQSSRQVRPATHSR